MTIHLRLTDNTNIIAECGKSLIADNAVTLISHGTKSKLGRHPWHVGLYKLNNVNEFSFTCGGSIISPNLVISGIHFFPSNVHNKNYNEFIFF